MLWKFLPSICTVPYICTSNAFIEKINGLKTSVAEPQPNCLCVDFLQPFCMKLLKRLKLVNKKY